MNKLALDSEKMFHEVVEEFKYWYEDEFIIVTVLNFQATIVKNVMLVIDNRHPHRYWYHTTSIQFTWLEVLCSMHKTCSNGGFRNFIPTLILFHSIVKQYNNNNSIDDMNKRWQAVNVLNFMYVYIILNLKNHAFLLNKFYYFYLTFN